MAGIDDTAEIEGARPTAEGRRYGVLVVDDEEAILESIELTLGSEYRVFTATSAASSLTAVQCSNSDACDQRASRKRLYQKDNSRHAPGDGGQHDRLGTEPSTQQRQTLQCV